MEAMTKGKESPAGSRTTGSRRRNDDRALQLGLHHAGRYRDAGRVGDILFKADPGALVAYNAACSWALAGETEQALTWLTGRWRTASGTPHSSTATTTSTPSVTPTASGPSAPGWRPPPRVGRPRTRRGRSQRSAALTAQGFHQPQAGAPRRTAV